ncbi:restriction endonuclease subunit S [Gulosibacter bifidus]|uniref:Restriction endonuclease subunit S n=1 Tax=Gulosibacter bifidus TaxID=272239 RepID=A0ABW5RJW1_9MICO|nr:restriction endonuclease subunit S [Gulosibacter bifidus]
MTRDNGTPALRLAGFDGEWEMKEFGSVVTRSNAASAEPALPRLEYEDIVSGLGVLNKDLSRKQSTKPGPLFVPGDVLYGKLRPYLKTGFFLSFRGIAVGDFWVLQSLTADPKFLYQLIQTPLFAAVASISSGSKMPRADWKLVSQALMAFPPTLEEQRTIGELFSDLDTLIEQRRAKHANLQQIKTALLQRMFPRDGADEPELRLDGFDGEWSVVEIHHIADVVGGGTPSTSVTSFWDGDIDWYSPNEIGGTAIAKSSNKRITAEGLANSSAKLLPANRTILFTSRASIGHAAILDHPATTNQGFQSLVLKDGVDTQFVYALVPKITEVAEQLATGSTFLEVSNKTVREIEVHIPGAEEQRAIGEVFANLDALIAAEASYITQLTQAKTALLQRMFV